MIIARGVRIGGHVARVEKCLHFFKETPKEKKNTCRPINLNVNQSMDSILYLITVPHNLFLFIVTGFFLKICRYW